MTSFLDATPIFLSYRILSLLCSLIYISSYYFLKKRISLLFKFPFNRRALYLWSIRIYLKSLTSPLTPNIQIIFNPILVRYRYRSYQKNFQKKRNPMESPLIPNTQIFSSHSRSISVSDRVGKISKKRSREILITGRG